MSTRTSERWPPPRFGTPSTRLRRAEAVARRLVDPQARSIWRDMRRELARCRGTILDVGCGGQPYRRLIPTSVAYIGIDESEAREHFGYDVPGTRYYSGDRWPVDDQSVDTVLCTEVLEHVRDPIAFLAEARRVLHTDGRLLLTVPFAARWHHIPRDYWRFTPAGLCLVLEKGGLAGVEVYARGNGVTVACQKLIAIGAPLLLPRGRRPIAAAGSIALGLVASPLLAGLAVIGNTSLMWDGGDDCLGYTVVAHHPGATPR